MRPVKTKADFVRRYALGEFGNASPTWKDFHVWMSSRVKRTSTGQRLYHLRNRIAGGPTWYNLTANMVVTHWYEQPENERSNYYVSEMAPTHLTVIQGEVQRTHRQLELFYSRAVAPMRDALRQDGKQVYGLQASHLLQRYLPPMDLEWLYYLLDAYDGHVVEFSTYDICWGTVPWFKTVYWEVRSY